MKRYETVEVVTSRRTVCIEQICDMCGRKAESPENDGMGFEWGAVGYSGGELVAKYCIDGSLEEQRVDLCYECAEWLVEQVRCRKIEKPGN